MENELLTRLDGVEERFEEVSTLITDPAVIADMKRYVALTKEYKELERLTGAMRRYRTMLANRAEAKLIIETEKDEDMRALA
ncbi:MAG: PCRF domain-containing protein, partial [Muribaculaceae bacterium]|nr:PCRF domain-containing protein [Muribaculaceae bacterium]